MLREDISPSDAYYLRKELEAETKGIRSERQSQVSLQQYFRELMFFSFPRFGLWELRVLPRRFPFSIH